MRSRRAQNSARFQNTHNFLHINDLNMNKKTDNSITCNKAQLAEMLGVTVRTLSSWSREFPPLPVHQKGEGRKGNLYDVGLCVKWYIAREKTSGQHLDLDQERANLAKMQALRTEQAIKEKSKDLLNRESVERMWSGIITELRAKILNADLTDEIKSNLIEGLRDIPVEKYAD